MTKRVIVVLTELEADELLEVAGNGYGDGNYYVEDDGGDTGRGGKRAQAIYLRAVAKIHAARYGWKRVAGGSK